MFSEETKKLLVTLEEQLNARYIRNLQIALVYDVMSEGCAWKWDAHVYSKNPIKKYLGKVSTMGDTTADTFQDLLKSIDEFIQRFDFLQMAEADNAKSK